MYAASGILILCRWPPAENENTRGCIHVQLTSLASWRWADDVCRWPPAENENTRGCIHVHL